MEKKDILPLTVITAVFLFLAVFNLGGTNSVDVTSEIARLTDPDIRSLSPGSTHMNNMFFDEIYFVRTAVEHIKDIYPYEISHPPLGKELISASILLFGMSPLGWRLIGAVFGVIMVSIMYIFIKNMFGKTIVAACGALLLGFDFMRFVQTRIATIDTYAVLFILISFFFMYRYITTDVDAPFRKSLAPLALSGLFFGFSVASKWIGFYAGAGLLIIYIIRLSQLGVYYKNAEKAGFGLYLTKTLLYSVLFFVIIPVTIYYLSYIPYGTALGMDISQGMLWDSRFFRLIWQNQISMFRYHGWLEATHPFSSTWWQWIFNVRPILYVNSAGMDNTRATFGAFGNPVVWWGGFVAMIIMAIRVFTHRDSKALLILIGYLSQLLPWVAVTRIVFAYHYFPSALFLVLALAHIFNLLVEHRKRSGYKMIYAYTVLTGLVFAMFYPSLSGMYMPHWYYSTFVKWFVTWPF
ncbi:MAG: phospholipid carrier-dependent glycosyltransferase [Oscillospiraceae bacterium]|nr:phospholipid carrier-dependent glycosyltransferase [Oscillospiraceae bacterium]